MRDSVAGLTPASRAAALMPNAPRLDASRSLNAAKFMVERFRRSFCCTDEKVIDA